MKRNENNLDRIIRIVIGIVVLGIALSSQSWILGIIGAVVLFTGVVGWCAIYQVLGLSTYKADQQ